MAGRVLSKENEKKLRGASEALAAILALLDKEATTESKEAKARVVAVAEAANMGHWLEARFHLQAVETVDYLFGDGKVNATERDAMLAGIDTAMAAFAGALAEAIPEIYSRQPWADAADDGAGVEAVVEAGAGAGAAALESDYIPLLERAVRADGTIPIKLIQPGWGSSGYYPKEVLQRDGPKVFVKGTKQYWNHATAAEEAQRPEGDLNALAAELTTDARYMSGPAGEGLYADAIVFGPYQEAINDLAPHIGVSIRATGRAIQGEAEGRKGPIITSLDAAKSVDFVTEAGAGGQIVEMFEAARERATTSQKGDQVNEAQFKEAMARVEIENARLREAMIARDAKDVVREALNVATLPAAAKARLLLALPAAPPIKEGALDTGALLERVKAAVADETKYLNEVTGFGAGRVVGMGAAGSASEAPSQEAMIKRMTESFRELGLDEKSAATAATVNW